MTRGGAHISGAVVLDQVRLAEATEGAVAHARALALMSSDGRAELTRLLPMSWCSLATSSEYWAALARATDQDVNALHRRMTRLGLERTFTTVWRFLAKLTSVEALVKRAAVIFGKAYDRGAVAARFVEPGRIDLTITGWPDMPDFELDALAAALEVLGEMAGQKDVVVRWHRRAGTIVGDVTYVAA